MSEDAEVRRWRYEGHHCLELIADGKPVYKTVTMPDGKEFKTREFCMGDSHLGMIQGEDHDRVVAALKAENERAFRDIASLREKLAEAEKDAARFRWIDAHPWAAVRIIDHMGHGMLSALIDAALPDMSATKPLKEGE